MAAHGRSPLRRPPYDLTVELKVTSVSGARSDSGSQLSGRSVPVTDSEMLSASKCRPLHLRKRTSRCHPAIEDRVRPWSPPLEHLAVGPITFGGMKPPQADRALHDGHVLHLELIAFL